MRYKKAISILLVLSLIFIFYGCTKDNKTASIDKGGKTIYRETILNDILKAEHITRIKLNSNNELLLLVAGENEKYILLDENGEVKKEINIDYEGSADKFDTDSEDNVYILSEMLDTNEDRDVIGIRHKLIFYDYESNSITEDNVIKEINDTTARTVEEAVRKIRLDSKGNIYALKVGGSIEIFDSSYNSKKTLDSIQYKDIEIDEEDNILALQDGIDNKSLDKIDGKNHSIIWSKEYDFTDRPDKIYYNQNTKSLYGMKSGWIMKYDSKGNMVDRLINVAEFSDIDFTFGFAVDNSEEIYILADVQKSYKLIKYTKSDSTEMEANTENEEHKTEITFETTEDYGNLFTKTARRFQEENPDIKVNVNLYPDLGNQYYDKLNTELMAGKGPDILYIRPWHDVRTYIEKGILVNLDELIEKDKEFNIEDYNIHMIDNARYEDKLYIMPISYGHIYVFLLNGELLEEKGITVGEDITGKDIYALSKKLNENSKEPLYVLPECDDYMLYDWFVWQDMDYYLDWNKKEAKFNSEEFIESIELLKAIKEDNVMHPDLSWYDIASKDLTGESVKDIAIFPGQTHAYHYIRSNGAVFNSFNAIAAPMGEYTGNRAYYSDFLAINANSQHKEAVWKFIKFMLSEEMQTMDDYTLQKDFHINNNATKKQIDKTIFEEQEKNKQYLIKNNQYFATEEDVEKLDKILESLNKPYILESFHNIVFDEVMLFLDGEKTAEEVAKQLQNKAEIYLNE